MARCFSSARIASSALSPYFSKSSCPSFTCMSSRALPMQKMEYEQSIAVEPDELLYVTP
jgi:hypothetical protein